MTMKKHLSEKSQMHVLKELVARVANESRIRIDDDHEEGWNIPEIARHSEYGLSSVSVSTLEKCLQPVLEGLGQIDATELLGLQHVAAGLGPQIKEGVFVRPIHDLITPTCDPGTVRYVHLSEVEGQYSMGVFIFPPLSVIPLHDHPGMCVLSRLLYGDLQRKSLDLAREQPSHIDAAEMDTTTQRATSWIPWTRSAKRRRDPDIPQGSKLAYRNRVDNLRAPDCTILFPFEGNLHEFVAGPHGAAVLDVLLPPYDHQHHRDCTFFEISELKQNNKIDSTNRDQVWITPTGQPENFHCISGSYDHLE